MQLVGPEAKPTGMTTARQSFKVEVDLQYPQTSTFFTLFPFALSLIIYSSFSLDLRKKVNKVIHTKV